MGLYSQKDSAKAKKKKKITMKAASSPRVWLITHDSTKNGRGYISYINSNEDIGKKIKQVIINKNTHIDKSVIYSDVIICCRPRAGFCGGIKWYTSISPAIYFPLLCLNMKRLGRERYKGYIWIWNHYLQIKVCSYEYGLKINMNLLLQN